MTRFTLRMISLLAVLGVAMPAHAATSFIAGTSCSEMDVGTTHIDDNNQNIVACLLDTDKKTKVWKSMTSSGGGGMCGFLVLAALGSYAYDFDGKMSLVGSPPDVTGHLRSTTYYQNRDLTAVIINTYCNGSSLIYNAGNSCGADCNITYTDYRLGCPSGYNLRLVSSDGGSYAEVPPSIWGLYSTNSDPNVHNDFSSTWTCIKN